MPIGKLTASLASEMHCNRAVVSLVSTLAAQVPKMLAVLLMVDSQYNEIDDD
jgi:hypothetical protein